MRFTLLTKTKETFDSSINFYLRIENLNSVFKLTIFFFYLCNNLCIISLSQINKQLNNNKENNLLFSKFEKVKHVNASVFKDLIHHHQASYHTVETGKCKSLLVLKNKTSIIIFCCLNIDLYQS